MRGANAKAGPIFRSLGIRLRHLASDRLSIGLLIGSVSVLVLATPQAYAWLWLIGAVLLIGWGLRHDEAWRRPRDVHENQALLEIASKAAKLGGWVVHLPDRRIEWSDETWAIHERPKGKTVTLDEGIGYFAPEWRDTITRHFETCVETGQPYDIEVEIVDGKGRRKWVRAIGVAIYDDMGRVARIQGALQDIDERKRLENAARDLERRFAESMENISDAFFQLDSDWRFTYLNRQAERLLERPRSTLLGCLIWQEFPEASSGIIRQQYERAARENVTADFEVFYEALNSWFSVTAYPGAGGLTVYFRDVTKRHAADQHLHLLEMAISRIEEFVIITNAPSLRGGSQTIVYVNDAFVRITGYSREDALGRSPEFLQGERTDSATIAEIERAVAVPRAIRADIINYSKDGREYWVDMSIAPILGPDGRATHVNRRAKLTP